MDELTSSGGRQRMVEYSPQLPQGFTPVTGTTFWPGQRVEATCDFDSRGRSEVTHAGATHHNEMCNLYMIMWSELPVFISCYDGFTSVDVRGSGTPPPPPGAARPGLPLFLVHTNFLTSVPSQITHVDQLLQWLYLMESRRQLAHHFSRLLWSDGNLLEARVEDALQLLSLL